MFHLFWVLIVGMLGVNIEYIVPMFQENRKYTGSMWRCLGACWEKVNSVFEHQAKGSKRETFNLALTESCLLVLCATVVMAATQCICGLVYLIERFRNEFPTRIFFTHPLFLYCPKMFSGNI